jgi:hypothetical protein
MKLKIIISLLLFTLLLLKCSTKGERNTEAKENLVESLNNNDSIKKALVIKLERGAFHYDSFILNDSILTFTPEHNITSEKANFYSTPIKTVITKKQREELIVLINNHSFWSLKDEYKANGSCTSGITISIELGNKHKTIISDDYKRDCPKILFLLEERLIELIGKDLKRINLPG